MSKVMGDNQVFDGTDSAFGLDLGEVQALAGRQLLASFVVAVIVVAAATLISFRPSHTDSAGLTFRSFAGAQQPTFVTQQTQRVAGLVRHEIELP
jgi:hypothetical protein